MNTVFVVIGYDGDTDTLLGIASDIGIARDFIKDMSSEDVGGFDVVEIQLWNVNYMGEGPKAIVDIYDQQSMASNPTYYFKKR